MNFPRWLPETTLKNVWVVLFCFFLYQNIHSIRTWEILFTKVTHQNALLAFTAQHLKRCNFAMKYGRKLQALSVGMLGLLIQRPVLITLQHESGTPLQLEFPKSELPLSVAWTGEAGGPGSLLVVTLMGWLDVRQWYQNVIKKSLWVLESNRPGSESSSA